MIVHTRESLEEIAKGIKCDCGAENCGRTPIGVVMVQGCHPGTGLNIAWDRELNIVTAFCANCGAPFIHLRIAEHGGH